MPPPAQTRPPANRRIRVSHADDPFRNQIHDFPVERRLQAIGHMSWYLLVQANSTFSQTAIEGRGAFDRLFRGLRATDYFHERYQVGRIERMPDHTALGMALASRLDLAHG